MREWAHVRIPSALGTVTMPLRSWLATTRRKVGPIDPWTIRVATAMDSSCGIGIMADWSILVIQENLTNQDFDEFNQGPTWPNRQQELRKIFERAHVSPPKLWPRVQ